jgi:flagellar biosynthesis protein FlhG
MKPITEQTYYEILEISPAATEKEIQRAYEHAKETFHADSLAVYALFSEREVKEVQAAVEEAYRVLMNEALRKSYDHSCLEREGAQDWKRPPEVQDASIEKKSYLSFTEISIDVGEGPYRGKRLREIRERMGIELNSVSKETKISTKMLESIEEERFEAVPAPVYLKGFLKAYAQFLGLDPQKVVEDYLNSMPPEKKKPR